VKYINNNLILAILFKLFGVLVSKHVCIIWISNILFLSVIWYCNLSNLSVPDEGYSRNASCTL